MTRSTDPRSAASDLPSFLGASEGAPGSGDVELESADSAAPETTGGAFDEQEDDYLDGSDEHYEEDEYEEDSREDEQAYDAPAAAPARASRRRVEAGSPPVGGVAATAAGAAVVLMGLAQLLVPAAAALAPAGWTPQLSITLGAVVAALGLVQRRVGQLQSRLAHDERQRTERDSALQDAMEQLLEHAVSQAADPSGGQHADRALLALQRQDQKINNLTKATKMYGKPLMEIAAQGTEVAGNITQLQAALEALAARSGEARSATELGDVPARIDALAEAVTASQEQSRADGLELKESLAQLRSQHADRSGHDQLQVRLAEATTRIGEGIDQLRDDNVAGLETGVRDVQHQVAALADAIAKLQSSTPGTTAAPTARAPNSEQPATSKAPTAPTAPPQHTDEGSDYATGERKSRGANVLGAIAKLKQMKG